MSGSVFIRNRQRALRVKARWLRQIARSLLRELGRQQGFELGICLVRATEMARLNRMFLGHEGSTDVITFDYSASTGATGRNRASRRIRAVPCPALHGEIVICADEVARQSHRFGTTWQKELARYVVHGVLHLEGYDDARPADRRRMKAVEDRLLAALARRFALRKLARKPRFAA